MSRLQAEWQRLHGPGTPAAPRSPDPLSRDARDPPGQPEAGALAGEPVRSLVLALGRPPDWAALSAVWRAVQDDWGLPAPGIAVDGKGAFQLWFSLAQPVPATEAHAFLSALCQQHLGHLPPQRLALWPDLDGHHTPPPVGTQVQADQWSAFVAPDLAPVFADTPWLDIAPNPEGQAELLARLRSITPAAWRAVQARVQAQVQTQVQARVQQVQPAPTQAADGTPQDSDPRRFLQGVMDDASAPLALRIEAAKALLHAPR